MDVKEMEFEVWKREVRNFEGESWISCEGLWLDLFTWR